MNKPSSMICVLSLLSLLTLTNAQQTGVTCSAVTPINVPRDPSLYWGTWYTIGTCEKCTSPSNVCTQVGYEPKDATSKTTNLTYIGSFQSDSPEGKISQAAGVMFQANVDTFDPLYRFDLDLGFEVIPSNFWILTTAGDGEEISAIATMSCGLTGTDQQIFFLSRKPYLVAPVTFDTLLSQTKRAITNVDAFNITSVYQGQGWCDYALAEVSIETTTDNCDCEDINETRLGVASGFSVFNAVILVVLSGLVVHSKFFAARGGKAGNDLNSNLI